MAGKWAAPMGRLMVPDERPANRAGQTAHNQAGWSGGNLAENDGKVSAEGCGDGGKGRM